MATPVGWHNGCIPDAMEPRRIVAKSNNARNRYWLFHKNDLREAAFVLRKKALIDESILKRGGGGGGGGGGTWAHCPD